MIAIKQENRKASARKAISVSVEVHRDEIDFSRVCADADDSDDTIFSACNSPDGEELHVPASTELGEYELAYLNSLYHPADMHDISAHNAPDTILPDAVAPPSLGASQVNIVPPTSASTHATLIISTCTTLEQDEEFPEEHSQPSTPPRINDTPWEESDSLEETNAPFPSPPCKAIPVVGKTSGRKRKATAPLDLPSPAPTRRQSANAERIAAAKVEHFSDDGDDSDTDSAGRPCAMLDGLEIRPEDDPLGLFSRDPTTLTPEEQRILKKQRRLLKNRESAQLSRHRKKMHLHQLEKQVELLKKDKASLAVRVQALQDDNDRLRKQLISVV